MASLVFAHFDSSRSYIYIWFSKEYGIAYVGQTNCKTGTLGRAADHVKKSGQLRAHFEDNTGLPLEKIEDLVCVSYTLPKSREFTSSESSYREAVEYLVQIGILNIRGRLSPPVRPISNVRYSERASLVSVKNCASKIISSFRSTYDEFRDAAKAYMPEVDDI